MHFDPVIGRKEGAWISALVYVAFAIILLSKFYVGGCGGTCGSRSSANVRPARFRSFGVFLLRGAFRRQAEPLAPAGLVQLD